MTAILRRIARFFRDESCGQCVPCRVGTVRQDEALDRISHGAHGAARARDVSPARRDRRSDARRVDLRPRADGRQRHRVGAQEPAPAGGGGRAVKLIDLTIDGAAAQVPEGATILDACNAVGVETPTLCYLETLTPVNACRVCVVELEGSRALVPACARRAEPGMKIQTDSPRVRHSRKMVLEFLGSSVDLSTAPDARRYSERYAADPSRYGDERATVAQPVKIDNDAVRARLLEVHPVLQVRRSVRRRRAEHVRDRGCGTRIRGARSRPNTTCRCRTRPASTAATASASARRAR